ncbi:MAG: hypothetical protein K0S32_16 [Bacteroidetes bacterium]|nr:hypothetical protein [Bacteroidota bacterium]
MDGWMFHLNFVLELVMAFKNKFTVLMFLFLCTGTMSSQIKTFVLDSAFSSMNFKIIKYYYEGKEKDKKKPKKPMTITLTTDSIKFTGRSLMFEDRSSQSLRSSISAKMNRDEIWKEIFPKDKLAHGYIGHYTDRIGTFKYYIIYSPAEDRYWFFFTHTVEHTYFEAERI